MKIRLTEEIWKEGDMYVSYCPELDVASCGENVRLAKRNLMEATIIDFEETKEIGTFDKYIEECGFELTDDDTMSARKELVGFSPIEVAV